MKKTIYYGFAVLLMLVVVATAAAVDNASSADVAPAYGCQGQGAGFVDDDGDGACDNLVDEDGDGINDYCDSYGAGNCGNGPRDGTGYCNGGAGAGGCNGGGCGQYNK
ncbi:MAG: hypothetical protein K0A90_02595 [Methanosarcinaceae archaeon]|nr:hypothetical protein [Methanosarcinaceae archaeon]